MIKEISHSKQEFEKIKSAGYIGKTTAPPIQPILDALSLQYGDLILTLGAGTGHFAIPIAQNLLQTGGALFACDFQKKILNTIRADSVAHGVSGNIQTISLENVKPRTLPFEDEGVDSVLTVNALQYFVEPLLYLKEIARVLTPCGSVIIADWQDDPAKWTDEKPSFALGPEDLYPLLDAAGLDAYTRLDIEGYAWAVRATKPLLVEF